MRASDFKTGLRFDPTVTKRKLAFAVPATFRVPNYVDCMCYYLPASNQGETPHCAGYATAGVIEQRRWRLEDIYQQIDGDDVYEAAKEHEGNSAEGTTLEFATEGAKTLGLLPKETQFEVITTPEQAKYAVHRFGGFLAGFQITEAWMTPEAEGHIKDSQNIIGGHAVVVVYYDKDGVGIANSWGESWGWNGFGRLSWNQFDQQFMYGLIWKGIPR